MVQAVPTAMKGAYFSCGQNCAGGERFFIQQGIYDQFLQQVGQCQSTASRPTLSSFIDILACDQFVQQVRHCQSSTLHPTIACFVDLFVCEIR